MTTKMTALSAYQRGKLKLPPGYRVERDVDVVTLHRADGSPVGAFVVSAAASAVVRTAEDDYRANGEDGA